MPLLHLQESFVEALGRHAGTQTNVGYVAVVADPVVQALGRHPRNGQEHIGLDAAVVWQILEYTSDRDGSVRFAFCRSQPFAQDIAPHLPGQTFGDEAGHIVAQGTIPDAGDEFYPEHVEESRFGQQRLGLVGFVVFEYHLRGAIQSRSGSQFHTRYFLLNGRGNASADLREVEFFRFIPLLTLARSMRLDDADAIMMGEIPFVASLIDDDREQKHADGKSERKRQEFADAVFALSEETASSKFER
ncbi:hypothetical protein HMPREF1988_01881 [Porphyromonas gingivalis F0185]|nr:hypothetical protein HMPREF1988_01881 [Porphyromonas gingivalis F0185]